MKRCNRDAKLITSEFVIKICPLASDIVRNIPFGSTNRLAINQKVGASVVRSRVFWRFRYSVAGCGCSRHRVLVRQELGYSDPTGFLSSSSLRSEGNMPHFIVVVSQHTSPDWQEGVDN
jgi:hypothetical protein